MRHFVQSASTSTGKALASLTAAAAISVAPVTLHAAGGGGGGGWSPPASVAPSVDLAAEFASGVAAIKAQDYKKAIRHLRVVAREKPKDADAQNYLGYAYRKTGDSKAALKYYGKALALNPNHPGANEYLGELYLEMKDVAKAEERLAVLNACCAGQAVTMQLSEAISEYKAKGSFVAKAPLLSY
jgi:tetratricopeptide (TPR) repeat protein